MQKWLVVLMTMCMAGFAQAQGMGGGGPGGGGAGMDEASQDGAPQQRAERRRRTMSMTKEQFVAREQRMAKRRGEAFDKAAAEAKFATLDKNKDGVLSGNELPQRPPMGPVTKEQFVQHQKRMAERAGEEFDPAAAEAKFTELDKNKDGVLTPDELRMNRPRLRGGDRDGDEDESAEAEGDHDGGGDQEDDD